jgi:hypothetical protein
MLILVVPGYSSIAPLMLSLNAATNFGGPAAEQIR